MKQVFSSIDNSFTEALTRLNPKPATPYQIYQGIKDKPDQLVAYVGARTGLQGDDLAAEAVRFGIAMRKRAG